ncbi:methyltransferase domain-containing protein [Salinicola acroporae]|uniref:tRNA 5-carboxymethoxyuridine methyltransferase n=1 Tax=Salinicola acroporae TaxID=1541440 RepID=A0ABT6I532_9GAMM|nr:methyltransferase domain-containing protein [Salinicola acroporae]MDH4572519.1 SAM-dependent methyltransferase [Salinicola acroporae]
MPCSDDTASRTRHGNDIPVGQDRIFDGLADKFANSLYATARGQIRLAVLDDVLSRALPPEGGPALDVGGGLGQMSGWLAERGHHVTLAEPSADMLAGARARFGGLPIQTLQAPIQALPELAPGPWPLIVCHAVLEWLAQPREAFSLLNALLAPGGRLSLMVFNRDALRFSNVVKGNLDKALEDRLSGTGRRQRLTPISPLTHADIERWCREEGLVIESVAGIRIFHDYLRERSPSEAQLETIIELEKRYCRVEPHWRLGRYLHYLIRRADGTDPEEMS